MKIKQKITTFLAFAFIISSIMSLGVFSAPAHAAFYDNQKECEDAKGIWVESCWLNTDDGKPLCKKAGGEWIQTDTNVPLPAAVALGDAGYCKTDGVKNTPQKCASKLSDPLTGECSEDKFCKKYSNKLKKNACKKGYVKGSQSCNGYKNTDIKKACKDGGKNGKDENRKGTNPPKTTGKTCGGVDTSILKCADNKEGSVEGNAIWRLLLIVIAILTAGIGLVAVGGLVYAGILYAAAGDNAGQVKKAKETIFNIVLGLVLFALMWSFLQFLIPGGIFS